MTNTGKTDMTCFDIYVGDTVKNIHSGLLFKVDKYGHLDNGNGLIIKNWDGDDYRIVESAPQDPRKESEPIELIDVTPVEDNPAKGPEKGQKTKGKRGGAKYPVGSKFVIVDGKRKLVRPGEPKPKPTQRAESLAGFSDQQLADELRVRGYEVKATKVTTIEL